MVSHRTAAVLWDLLSPDAESEVHVTVLGRNPGVDVASTSTECDGSPRRR